MDVSLRSLDIAEEKLGLGVGGRLPDKQRERIRLLHGSLPRREPRPRGESAAKECHRSRLASRSWLAAGQQTVSHDREASRLRKNVIATPLGAVRVQHLTAARVEDHLHELERAGVAPASVNHVRAKLRTVFFKARKAGLWIGPNPITETESRRVPKRVHPTLRMEEIARVLEHVPALWRPFTATAIYGGLRKGELCGLRKSDVDLDAGMITVRCSYDRETTKGGHADVIPIAPALAPYLQAAIDASPSDLVFPWD